MNVVRQNGLLEFILKNCIAHNKFLLLLIALLRVIIYRFIGSNKQIKTNKQDIVLVS